MTKTAKTSQRFIKWPTALPLLFVLFLAPATAPAQTPDTPKFGGVRKMSDSIPDAALLADTLFALDAIQRRPRKALLWSIIPGGGQVYNKRWWKVPLVYGGLLGAVAAADFNQTRYTRFRNGLEARCLGEGNFVIIPNSDCIPNENAFNFGGITNEALLQARNRADQARQTAYIGILLAIVLQSVEAYTDAHLQQFDISEDLSFKLGPVVQPNGQLAAGLTVPLGSGRKVNRQVRQVERLRRVGR